MADLLNIIKKLNLNSIVSNTNKTLNTVKKVIPVYKEVRPYIKKEKSLFNKSDIDNKIIETKSNVPNKSYIENDSLTFFH